MLDLLGAVAQDITNHLLGLLLPLEARTASVAGDSLDATIFLVLVELQHLEHVLAMSQFVLKFFGLEEL